jgi:hypothetical protein
MKFIRLTQTNGMSFIVNTEEIVDITEVKRFDLNKDPRPNLRSKICLKNYANGFYTEVLESADAIWHELKVAGLCY